MLNPNQSRKVTTSTKLVQLAKLALQLTILDLQDHVLQGRRREGLGTRVHEFLGTPAAAADATSGPRLRGQLDVGHEGEVARGAAERPPPPHRALPPQLEQRHGRRAGHAQAQRRQVSWLQAGHTWSQSELPGGKI